MNNLTSRLGFLFVLPLLMACGGVGQLLTGDDGADATDYAETHNQPTLDPCTQDIMNHVSEEDRRCPQVSKPVQLSTRVPTDAPPTPTDYPIGAVISNGLRVRSGPGTEFAVVGSLTHCSTVSVLEQDGEWLYVDGNRLTGYVYGPYVSYDLSVCNDGFVPFPPSPSANTLEATPVPLPPSDNCAPSYPGRCIPPPPPDLDCSQIPDRNFQVLQPDPHGFDRDKDGVGCET